MIEELKKRFCNLYGKNLLGIFGDIFGAMADFELIDIVYCIGFKKHFFSSNAKETEQLKLQTGRYYAKRTIELK